MMKVSRSGCPPSVQQPGQGDGSGGRDMQGGPKAEGGGKQQQQYGRGHSSAQTTYSSACC